MYTYTYIYIYKRPHASACICLFDMCELQQFVGVACVVDLNDALLLLQLLL